jgi:hypothetical protein
LGAVEFEVVEAERFRGDKAVGARWRAVQAFVEEVQNGLGPGRGVVAAGAAGEPERSMFFSAGAEVSGGERVEAAWVAVSLRCRNVSRTSRIKEGA